MPEDDNNTLNVGLVRCRPPPSPRACGAPWGAERWRAMRGCGPPSRLQGGPGASAAASGSARAAAALGSARSRWSSRWGPRKPRPLAPADGRGGLRARGRWGWTAVPLPSGARKSPARLPGRTPTTTPAEDSFRVPYPYLLLVHRYPMTDHHRPKPKGTVQGRSVPCPPHLTQFHGRDNEAWDPAAQGQIITRCSLLITGSFDAGSCAKSFTLPSILGTPIATPIAEAGDIVR